VRLHKHLAISVWLRVLIREYFPLELRFRNMFTLYSTYIYNKRTKNYKKKKKILCLYCIVGKYTCGNIVRFTMLFKVKYTVIDFDLFCIIFFINSLSYSDVNKFGHPCLRKNKKIIFWKLILMPLIKNKEIKINTTFKDTNFL